MDLRRTLVIAALAFGAAPAAAAQGAASLPADTRALGAAPGGCAATTYTAPMSGYLTTRLTGRGDWDLTSSDGQASRAFGGNEVVQRWIAAGERTTADACRTATASGKATVSFTLTDVAPPRDQTGKVVRVFTGREGQEQLDLAGLDLTHARGANWTDVVVYTKREQDLIDQLGAKTETRIRDIAALDRKLLGPGNDGRRGARVSALPTGRDAYRTYEDIQNELKQLVTDHPDRVRPVIFGESYQGREISGVEIADDVKADDDGRPVFFLMGVHHAREWPSAEITMEYAHLLAQAGDARVKNILEKGRVVILPLVNPDGYISSRTAPSVADTVQSITGDGSVSIGESVAPPGGVLAYKRKNCNNEDDNPMTPCEIAHGVDNNRNYGNLWGGPGSSADVTSQSYHGPAPRSEKETQAVFDYVRAHHVTTLISVHTIAGLVLRPPGLKELGRAPDERAMKELGDAMGAATGYESQYSFELYDTAGTTEDDTYAATGGYGYTIELGPSAGFFHGPYETNVVAQWTGDGGKAAGGMREALLKAAEVSIDHASHARLAGTAKPNAVLRLRKRFQTQTSPFCKQGLEAVVQLPIPPETTCFGPIQDAITLDDAVDYETRVRKDGTFAWHVGQSTRPFVNGGAEFDEETVVEPPAQTIPGQPGAPGSVVDHEFTAPADLAAADKLRVRLNVPSGEDYDLEVLRKNADGSFESVGLSANPPLSDDEVTVEDPVAGATYVARVTFALAGSGGYEVQINRVQVKTTVSQGRKEAYTLTCEAPGGKVLERLRLVIDRTQLVNLNLGCGDGPSTDGAGNRLSTDLDCALPATAPTVGCKTVPTGAASAGGRLTVRLLKARRRQDLRRLERRGFYAVRCRLSAAGTCRVRAKVGKVRVGAGRVRMRKANTRTVRIKVRARALRRIRRGGRIRLRATGRTTGGAPVRAKLRLPVGPQPRR